MALAVTNIGTATGTAGATLTITLGAGVSVPTGSVVVVGVSEFSTTSTAAGTVTLNVVGSSVFTERVSRAHNNVITNGVGGVFDVWNSAAISSGSIITYTRNVSASDAAITAFYVTGIQSSADPYDANVGNSNFGNSTAPTVTSGSPTNSGELFVGLVTKNSTISTYTQATSTAWTNTPAPVTATRTGAAIAGGYVIHTSTGTLAFSPTINTGTWAAFVVGYKSDTASRSMTANTGYFILTGQAATTTKTTSVSVTDSNLLPNWPWMAVTPSFTFTTGAAAISGSPGRFVLTGEAVTLKTTRVLSAATGY